MVQRTKNHIRFHSITGLLLWKNFLIRESQESPLSHWEMSENLKFHYQRRKYHKRANFAWQSIETFPRTTASVQPTRNKPRHFVANQHNTNKNWTPNQDGRFKTLLALSGLFTPTRFIELTNSSTRTSRITLITSSPPAKPRLWRLPPVTIISLVQESHRGSIESVGDIKIPNTPETQPHQLMPICVASQWNQTTWQKKLKLQHDNSQRNHRQTQLQYKIDPARCHKEKHNYF